MDSSSQHISVSQQNDNVSELMDL